MIIYVYVHIYLGHYIYLSMYHINKMYYAYDIDYIYICLCNGHFQCVVDNAFLRVSKFDPRTPIMQEGACNTYVHGRVLQ